MIWEFAAALVCQVIVALVLVMLLVVGLEIVNVAGVFVFVLDELVNPEHPLLHIAKPITSPASAAEILRTPVTPLAPLSGFMDSPQSDSQIALSTLTGWRAIPTPFSLGKPQTQRYRPEGAKTGSVSGQSVHCPHGQRGAFLTSEGGRASI